MASTIVSENFADLIDKFDVNTGVSTTSSGASWKILFNDTIGSVINSSIYSTPNVYGNHLTYNSSLKLYGSNVAETYEASPIYTNPGLTSLKYNGSVTNLSSFKVTIDSIPNTSNQYYRSYDLFEEISNEFLEDNYQFENTFIGLSNSTMKIGIVILKPPSKLKIKNKNQYTNKILSLGAIGKTSACDLEEVCAESLISENERILALVYYKDGLYYNANGVRINSFSELSDGYAFRYFGSGTITELDLSNIGTDGRVILGSLLNKYASTKYSSPFINSKLNTTNNVLNTSFYPTKDKNLTINSYSINSNNTLIINVSQKIISNKLQLLFNISNGLNAYSYSSLLITLDNPSVALTPTIEVADFSDNPSLSIASVNLTFDPSSTLDDSYNAYLKKYPEPIVTFYINSIQVDYNDIILTSSESLTVQIQNIATNSAIYYNLTGASTQNGASGDNIVTLSLNTPGSYTLTALISGWTASITNSETLIYNFTIYEQALPPTISYVINDLGNSLTNTTVTLSSTEDADIYFSIDGSTPTNDNTFKSVKYNNAWPSFTFESGITIYAYSKNSTYLTKSNVVSLAIPVSKTITTIEPIITAIKSDDNYLITISESDNSAIVYYTLDGSTPTNKSIKYNSSFEVCPILGETLTIKSIAIKTGALDSVVASLLLNFDYSCASWINETSSNLIIENGKITIPNNSLLTKQLSTLKTYKLSFKILDITNLINLIVCPRASYENNNNYTGSIFTNIIPYLSATYTDSNIAILALGKLFNMSNKDDYQKYGTFTWNKTNPLTLTYEITYINSNYIQVLTISDTIHTLTSNSLSICNILDNSPCLIVDSIFDVASTITIGNITMECN